MMSLTVFAMGAMLASTSLSSAQETPYLEAKAADPVTATQTAPVPEADSRQWRSVIADRLLVIDTNKGRILVELVPEVAPDHVARIRLLAGRGFYDGLLWHRVIDSFMAQTGDPLGTGDGQSYFADLKGEFTFRRGRDTPFVAVAKPAGGMVGFVHSLPVQTQPDAVMAGTSDRKVHGWGLYCAGTAGMARGDDNDSANSQFFLMRQPYPPLDKRYSVWGQVISGLDVVRALKFSPNPDGLVTDPDKMVRVRLASDLPQAERPQARVLDTASPQFRALVETTRQAKGADFSVCDIELPVEVS